MSRRPPRRALRAARWAVALGMLAVLAAPVAAQARQVRVFAVGPKLSLTWLDTRAHFHDKLLALVDRRRRGAGAPAVQAGADDVASHLLGPSDRGRARGTARDLVALPEDLGLMAIFTGSRGAAARAVPAKDSIAGAIVANLTSYADLIAYYEARHPELKARGLPLRQLFLAGTDTFARVAVETYAELADRYDVYLEAGVNMAQSWRVVCVDRATFRRLPGGVGCDRQDPAAVARLRSPDEPQRDYAYEATTPKVSNMALVFDPDGRLISKQIKAYLTPTELPGQLDLVPGEVSTGLSALRTPVGTLGFVTSKDAWMPDVTAKLDQAHVDLLVQPEFFVNDTVLPRGPWAPDTLKSAGYSDVLRHPSIQALLLPELTGNVYDFSADAQQHIAVKPRSTRPGTRFLVGQPAAPGLLRVQPWLTADPARRGESFAARRSRLGDAGARALPLGSGPACPSPVSVGACRGGQAEGVIHADVTVDRAPLHRSAARRKRGATPFTVNRPIAPSGRAQRNVSLAARGRDAWAVFEERRGAHDQVLLAHSSDGGRTWGRTVRPTGRAPGAANEWWPSVAAGPDGRVWVAWQDDSTGTPRVYLASSSDGGRRFSRATAVDPRPGRGVHQWRPSVASGERGVAVVAFVDERERSADDALPQAHVYVARARAAGVSAARRIDGGTPVKLAAKLDNSWAPHVTAAGRRALVTWIDFAGYDWDVWSRTSADGGATFAAQRRVNDTPDAQEALDDTPRGVLTDRGPLVAFTDWRKLDSTARSPHQLYDIATATPGGPDRQADGAGTAQVSAFAPAIVAQPAGGALVAWQDHRRGPGDVLVARVRGGRAGRAVRADDLPATSGVNQWRPAIALTAGGRLLAAWEDERDGPAQVFAAVAAASAVR